jgi:dCMP deaminase
MKCKKHNIEMTVIDVEGVPYCEVCKLFEKDTIIRDSLGYPVDWHVNDKYGQRVNVINNEIVLLSIGDNVLHSKLGTGTVVWISENNSSLYPIKIHFKKHRKYIYCNVYGNQFRHQSVPHIEFVFPYKCAEKKIKAMSKWDHRFMDMAELVASWSKDPSTQCGAVIVDKNHRVISVGYNGYPKSVSDKGLDNREEKYAKVLHAELNAILFSQRDLKDHTIYVTHFPCAQCASLIVQTGIKRVVTYKPEGGFGERWDVSNRIAVNTFSEAGVEIDEFEI